MKISDFKPHPVFTQDGFKTYLVVINVIGIENDLYLLSPGNSEKEAINCAIETVSSIKHNDMEIKNVSEIRY